LFPFLIMADKPDNPADDSKLFREAMRGVRRHEHDRHHYRPSHKPRPIPYQTLRDEREVLDDMFSDAFRPGDVETGEELLFARTGLQHRVMRQLRRGQYRIEAELDLHGMTVNEARIALTDFLKHCRRSSVRCIRIVHGKGHGSRQKLPVLKNKVNGWLRQRDEVLAFSSALPVDGGTGAVYVLLKRG
jgi:DNA-nicking Smr family endonuclease